MTKRASAKATRGRQVRKTQKTGRKRQAIPMVLDNEELLLWKRVEGKGLYELYRANTGGPYFVRHSNDQSTVRYAMSPRQAESIILQAKRKRIEQIPNPSLRNGYRASFYGEIYDTRLDEVVFVGVGSETNAAVIYRNRNEEYYVHHIENGVDEILTVSGNVGHMETAIDFWFNPRTSSFIQFLLWVHA
jgi:hypothetical protein